MLKVAVTVGCALALALAAAIVFRLRKTQRTPSPLLGNEPFRQRLATTIGRTGGMLVGAYLAGVLTVGPGLRLMMRFLAVTSSDGVQGQLTEANEVIGKVSFGGGMFLIVIAGIGTSLAGLALFSLLRRWLPQRSVVAGLLGVAIGSGLLVRPAGLISSANRDFELVAPAALAVALCLATLVLFGATFGVLVDYLAPVWPVPGWNPLGVLSLAPFAMLLPAPSFFAVTVLAVLGATFASKLRSPTTPEGTGQQPTEGADIRWGRTIVTGLGVIGSLSLVTAAGQVLAL